MATASATRAWPAEGNAATLPPPKLCGSQPLALRLACGARVKPCCECAPHFTRRWPKVFCLPCDSHAVQDSNFVERLARVSQHPDSSHPTRPCTTLRRRTPNGCASGAGAFCLNLRRRMRAGFSINCPRRLQALVSTLAGWCANPQPDPRQIHPELVEGHRPRSKRRRPNPTFIDAGGQDTRT